MAIFLSRLDIYPIVDADGTPERDALSVNFNNFAPSRKVLIFTTDARHCWRPDLVAYTVYGIPELWWFIYKINGIINPFDLPSGTKLEIPALADVYDFLRANFVGD